MKGFALYTFFVIIIALIIAKIWGGENFFQILIFGIKDGIIDRKIALACIVADLLISQMLVQGIKYFLWEIRQE